MHASHPGPPADSLRPPTTLRHGAAGVVVTLRPVASPTSLGLFGLAAASLVLAGVQLGWVGAGDRTHAGLVLIGFACPAQLVASLVAFRARDGVLATAMGVLALTWLSTGAVVVSGAGPRSTALGLLLLVSALAVALTGLTALTAQVATGVVLLTAGTRLGLTAADQLGAPGLTAVAGWLGVGLSGLALLVAWAGELESARGRSPIPLGRRGKGRLALEGDYADQVDGIATEPGVRMRL